MSEALDETDADWLGNALGVTVTDGLGELLVRTEAVCFADAAIETEKDWLLVVLVEREID